MAFLEVEELKTVGDLNIVRLITNPDEVYPPPQDPGENPPDPDLITKQIITESIDVMKSYLSRNYDAEDIFSKEGNQRNATVLKHLKGIVIYEVYMRYSKQINEATAKRYEEAMLWLEQLNTGKLFIPTLPSLSSSDSSQDDLQVRFGGGSKYSTNY